MLKSTHRPSQQPLPPGWTEHRAPSGHAYYYNNETNESTYKRPGAQEAQTPTSISHEATTPTLGTFGPQAVPSLADPAVANAYMAYHHAIANPSPTIPTFGRQPYSRETRNRPQPVDKPKSKVAIPGCEPWVLVFTKYGRRFAYNTAKNASYWRIPDKLKPAILELDQARIREKAQGQRDGESHETVADAPPRVEEITQPVAEAPRIADGDSSEYEEVEVTDDEAEGSGPDNGDHRSKRQRMEGGTEDDEDDAPAVEFSEADIAFQLQAMGEEYGLAPGEYDDGNEEDWPEGATGVEFTEEDAKALFKDLLNDFRISPFSPWDKLIQDGHIIEDARYTALGTMKARRETWDEWSRDRIREIKERRANEEKADPKIAYMGFLAEHATPKLYWPEFKRKYRKEACMKDTALLDKDREKWYRELINRFKMPQSTLKSDLTAFLKTLPLSVLHNASDASNLPPRISSDLRYVSLDAAVRDPLIEAYIQTLGPPPEKGSSEQEDEAAQKAQVARKKRELALEAREKAVAEQKRRQQISMEVGKARLREGERELERAMQVGKRGLQSQLS